MAVEIMRVGKRYFVQTPNYYFPFEPHFLFPLFQFLPASLKIFLVKNFNMGWYGKTRDAEKAEKLINSIKLLKRADLKKLFPQSGIYSEKLLGLTKSFIVYK